MSSPSPSPDRHSISGWGNRPRVEARVRRPRTRQEVAALVEAGFRGIARGLGRAYGDAAVAEEVMDLTRLRRFIAFDEETGCLEAEAGVTLADLLETFVPRGWLPPVVPGTKFVTLGGAVAADIHGKNHHRDGSLGHHLDWIELVRADGATVRCSPEENPDLFHATCGGMGLTGIITRLALRLRRIPSAFIRMDTRKAANLTEIMAAFETADAATYSVAWIDCLAGGPALGRSILMTGEHAEPDELPARRRADPFRIPGRPRLNVPLFLPGWALNHAAMKAFNEIYYRRPLRARSYRDLDRFFFPLDSIGNWNRIYGRRGFIQYQFVLPRDRCADALPRILERIQASGRASFLAVLKLFGPAHPDRPPSLGFPREGYTLALDFPWDDRTERLTPELDALVLEAGGRIYLAKDACMAPATFATMYPQATDVRAQLPDGGPARFASHQSGRLELTP